MLKKCMALILAFLLMPMAFAQPVAANTKAEKELKLAEKVKAGITKLGTGPQARVEVKLRDKTKLAGYVSEASDDHFVIVDSKTGASTAVAYPQVVKAKGHNLSTGASIAIGVAILVTIILIPFILIRD